MHAVEALGNQELDRLAEELLARVAEQGLRLEVGELDQAVAVNDDHRVGGGFDQPLSVLDAEGRLAIGPALSGLPSLGCWVSVRITPPRPRPVEAISSAPRSPS